MAQTDYQNRRGTLRVHVLDDPSQFDSYVAEEVIGFFAGAATTTSVGPGGTPNTLCVASGDSPKAAYDALAERRATGRFDTSGLTLIKLDEWHPMGMDDPSSCELFLRRHLVEPLGIPGERYIAFDSGARDPEAECARIDRALDAAGGIGLSILGVGKNGHVGLNEPGGSLELRSHYQKISERTKTHTMLGGRNVEFGLTLGMRDLLASRRAMLLVRGEGKEEALRELFSGRISLNTPATLMLLHGNLDIVCDARPVAPVRSAIEELLARL